MATFYYSTRLYFRDYTFIENYVDDFGVEVSVFSFYFWQSNYHSNL